MAINTFTYKLLNLPVCSILAIIIFAVSLFGFFNKKYVLKLLLHPVSILRDKQYYRLFTSDLVHHDFIHLMLNEVMFFTYGGNLEQHLNEKLPLGSLRFVAIYICSCLFSSVGSTLRNRDNFGYSSAGASGSVIGCLFSYTMVQPNMVAFSLPVIGYVTNVYFSLIVIIGISIYKWRRSNELLNHDLHFFGALGGIISTLVFCPEIVKWPG